MDRVTQATAIILITSSITLAGVVASAFLAYRANNRATEQRETNDLRVILQRDHNDAAARADRLEESLTRERERRLEQVRGLQEEIDALNIMVRRLEQELARCLDRQRASS